MYEFPGKELAACFSNKTNSKQRTIKEQSPNDMCTPRIEIDPPSFVTPFFTAETPRSHLDGVLESAKIISVGKLDYRQLVVFFKVLNPLFCSRESTCLGRS